MDQDFQDVRKSNKITNPFSAISFLVKNINTARYTIILRSEDEKLMCVDKIGVIKIDVVDIFQENCPVMQYEIDFDQKEEINVMIPFELCRMSYM